MPLQQDSRIQPRPTAQTTMATRLGVRSDLSRQDPRSFPSKAERQQVPPTHKHKIILMKSPQNPWQKLLQQHIKDRFAPPAPEGYYTIEQVSKMLGKTEVTTARILNQMLEQKKVDAKRHPFVIPYKDRFVVRQLKVFKILPTKHPHK